MTAQHMRRETQLENTPARPLASAACLLLYPFVSWVLVQLVQTMSWVCPAASSKQWPPWFLDHNSRVSLETSHTVQATQVSHLFSDASEEIIILALLCITLARGAWREFIITTYPQW